MNSKFQQIISDLSSTDSALSDVELDVEQVAMLLKYSDSISNKLKYKYYIGRERCYDD